MFPEWLAAIGHPLTDIGWSFSLIISTHPASRCPFITQLLVYKVYCHIGSLEGTPTYHKIVLVGYFHTMLSKLKYFILFCDGICWKRLSWQYELQLVMLPHWGWVMHVYVQQSSITHNLGHHWFRRWLIPCYMNQCWFIFISSRDEHKWNLNQNVAIFTQENWFEHIVYKLSPFCLTEPQCVKEIKLKISFNRWLFWINCILMSNYHILILGIMNISLEIAHRWMPQAFIGDKSILLGDVLMLSGTWANVSQFP